MDFKKILKDFFSNFKQSFFCLVGQPGFLIILTTVFLSQTRRPVFAKNFFDVVLCKI